MYLRKNESYRNYYEPPESLHSLRKGLVKSDILAFFFNLKKAKSSNCLHSQQTKTKPAAHEEKKSISNNLFRVTKTKLDQSRRLLVDVV